MRDTNTNTNKNTNTNTNTNANRSDWEGRNADESSALVSCKYISFNIAMYFNSIGIGIRMYDQCTIVHVLLAFLNDLEKSGGLCDGCRLFISLILKYVFI